MLLGGAAVGQRDGGDRREVRIQDLERGVAAVVVVDPKQPVADGEDIREIAGVDTLLLPILGLADGRDAPADIDREEPGFGDRHVGGIAVRVMKRRQPARRALAVERAVTGERVERDRDWR